MNRKTVGILGGGQLGRMLASAAALLNIQVVILDSGPDAPAKQVVLPPTLDLSHVDGSFTDASKIRELAEKVDVLTVEIEHVDALALEQWGSKVDIHPSPRTIEIIQDKFRQKEHLRQNTGCPVSEFLSIDHVLPKTSIQNVADKLGLPLMLKKRKLSYDGRGNFALYNLDGIDEALSALGGSMLYAEKWVPFEKEIAVMVVKGANDEVRSYPTVETVHRNNICHLVFAPLRTGDPGLDLRARRVAEEAVSTFEGAGIFGVEMFLMNDGTIYINEIAPRPHNSGHYTIEACETSQFENHLRAILGLPLGSTALKVQSAAMLNLIGHSTSMQEILETANKALLTPGASVHLYGKKECRKGRKMGHITIVAESDAQLRAKLRPLLESLPSQSPGEDPISEIDKYCLPQPSPGSGLSSPFPLISIIMGSDSDLPTLLPAARILDQFKLPYELTIVSAHRTPDRLMKFAKEAAPRGVRVIIAAAGGAAHLPGMVAAVTPLPVVGVPVRVQGSGGVEGVDSLYSIVQMPRGIPVATVAINNSTNAALLSIRILSAGIPHLVGEMQEYMKKMENEVMKKIEKLEEIGWEEYVKAGKV
ncbi:hypothetical protein M378DRAFT_167767 [Amanita muscaria Koide BX008]|uniref:Phosphoribosylaminoimidazole carboxylase n=1 Tax=Amanita muscaria (strain Koide BX008) TaxID=946122 RepID=A0A0C2WH32_AMAMK|nr:hypothetical protein M378DRAFT_167767 [Amanita muscaria Koide BX008]